MIQRERQSERNVDGLRQRAREKAVATRERVEAALNLLLKEGRAVTFTAVAEAAPCSTAWLYAHEGIKQRIVDLRARQAPAPKIVVIPPRERASDASKEVVIAVLRAKIKELRAENEELRKQREVAYGLVHGHIR